MEEWLRLLQLNNPAVGLALVALAGLMEYLLPPLPGDTLMLLGFFLAGHGDLPFSGVLVAALAGSMAGAEASYRLGAKMGQSYFFLRRSRFTAGVLPVLQRYLSRFGTALLLLNRFLPVLRGFFLYAAGMGRMPWKSTFFCANASNLAWILLIAWVGHHFGSSWDRLQEAFRAYTGLIGIILLAYVVFTLLRYRFTRQPSRTR
jgi:membrane protein DedA with SNARE-associated domain